MKRSVVVAAVAAVASLFGGLGPGPAQAGRCDSSVALAIGGGYYGVGGPGSLDSWGCVGGQEAVDTRVLPPRAEFVVVVVAAQCTPGQTLPTAGSSLQGLGAAYTDLDLRCSAPDAAGRTAYISSLYPISPAAAGTITAVVNFHGSMMSTQSRSALPVEQPA